MDESEQLCCRGGGKMMESWLRRKEKLLAKAAVFSCKGDWRGHGNSRFFSEGAVMGGSKKAGGTRMTEKQPGNMVNGQGW